MVDAMMADIQKMSTSMFVTSYSKNFHYVGSVLEVMLARVPMDSDIIQAWRQITKFGAKEISLALQAILDVGDAPKRGGV